MKKNVSIALLLSFIVLLTAYGNHKIDGLSVCFDNTIQESFQVCDDMIPAVHHD